MSSVSGSKIIIYKNYSMVAISLQ